MRSILPFPRSLKLSQLVHGEVGDFIINAHLALQHRWPERRAYDQYKKRLKGDPSARALVLREIAASTQAQDEGVEVVDDLGPDYQFTHTGNDFAKANQVGNQLRIYQLYHDLQNLQLMGGASLGDGPSARQLSEQAEEMAELGERFGRLSESVLQLYTEKEKGLLGGAPASAQAGPELMQDLQSLRSEMAQLRTEVQGVAKEFQYFKDHGLWDIKRHAAEYVVAMLDVQQSLAAAQRKP